MQGLENEACQAARGLFRVHCGMAVRADFRGAFKDFRRCACDFDHFDHFLHQYSLPMTLNPKPYMRDP